MSEKQITVQTVPAEKCHVLYFGKNDEKMVRIPYDLTREEGIRLSRIIEAMFDEL